MKARKSYFIVEFKQTSEQSHNPTKEWYATILKSLSEN